MNVQPVNNSPKTTRLKMYYDCSKIAGYGALGTGGLALIQGIRHKKSHKILGLLSVAFACVHAALIEIMNHTAKHKNNTV